MRLLGQAGQAVFMAGLFVAAGTQDQAAVGLSGLMVALMIAAVLFGLPGGALSDRLGASRGMFVGAIGRTVAMAAALLIDGRIEVAFAVAFLYSAVSQVFSPSELAMVHWLSPRKPCGTHAALVALQHAGQGVGFVLLTPLALWIGGPQACFLAAVTLYGAVSLMALWLAHRSDDRAVQRKHAHAFTFGHVARFLTGDSLARRAGLLLAFSEISAKAMLVALPLYISEDLGLDGTEQLAVVIPGVIGVLGGLAWAGRSLELGIAHSVLRLTLAGTVVSVIALAGLGDAMAGIADLSQQAPLNYMHDHSHVSLAIAIPVSLLLGICYAVAPIGGRSVLSSTAADEEQGRVFAVQATVTDMLAIVPLVAAGVGAELAGAQATFLFVGILGAALFVALELGAFSAAALPKPVAKPISVEGGQ